MTTPPQPHPDPVWRMYHGRWVHDTYAWLRPAAWQTVLRDPSQLPAEIREHLEAENTYTETVLSPQADLRARLKEELRERIPDADESVPEPDGGYAYFRRYRPGDQHPVLCRQAAGAASPDAAEEILVDGNAEAHGQAYFRLSDALQSPDHRLFAYTVDITGAESHTLRILDTESGRVHDAAEGLAGEFVWANDSRTLFYTVLDDTYRASRVYRLDAETGAANEVYREPDPAFALGLDRLQRRRFLVIEARDHSDTTEIHLIDADAPGNPPRCLRPREAGVTYTVEEHEGRLLLLTNAGGADDFAIRSGSPDATDPLDGTTLVPHRPGVLIKDMVVRSGHLARLELADGRPRLVITDLSTGSERITEPPAADTAHALALRPGFIYATSTIRVVTSSPRQPPWTFDLDMHTGTWTLRKSERVPSGHDPDAYAVERITVDGHDGAGVPVTLLYHRDSPPSPERPLVLYGYGAYGMAVPASFSRDRLSFVERGVVCAIAHVRGGTEKGYRWYADGKLARKTNTFHDYIAAADGLTERGYTGRGRIVANGRSAGGMLMGVAANWRPDLFAAVVGEVPFVDVLNTMLDAALPLTPPEWDEWGDPLHEPTAFDRIAAYAPCDNVVPQPYPAILATAGISDPRVTFWEPAKWVARLRAIGTGTAPICFSVEMGAGHGGAAGRFGRLDEVALVQSFMLSAVGRAR